MKRFGRRNDKGFTLIEMIIVISVAAILGTMMFTYSQTSLTKSAQPLNQSKKAMALQKVMESISADYNKNFTKDLVALQAKIANPASQQPPTAGYGPYTLVYNDFVKLVATDPPETEKKILKVTIKNDLGETLSILFTKHE